MNEEKHTPNEDWEMSVSNVSPPETAVENDGGGWKMPEPVFRVSEGDKVEKSEIRSLVAEENFMPDHFAPQEQSFVLEQPDISEEFNASEIPEPTYEPEKESIKSEDGNTKWVVLLGGIFIFFAGLVGIMLGVYFIFWR